MGRQCRHNVPQAVARLNDRRARRIIHCDGLKIVHVDDNNTIFSAKTVRDVTVLDHYQRKINEMLTI